MLQQLARVPRVFGGDSIALSESPESSEGDILEVANGGCDEVEGARVQGRQ